MSERVDNLEEVMQAIAKRYVESVHANIEARYADEPARELLIAAAKDKFARELEMECERMEHDAACLRHR
ncbi:hypothetical protein [Hyphomicrobium sp.]|uniref:hypothetical protein n=1 Tax=Hyphomicrobium sp. TaxID=82 RepID=UPI001D3F06EF|nr:hypothetical protein [Hyphomicrobium sp.]MBY0559904.1 hypothetical protein [Hyphomicrobium sp.]